MSICFFVLYFYYVVDIRLCQRCFFLLYFKKIYGRLLLEIIGYVNPYQCVNLYNISCILCSRWYGSTLFYFSLLTLNGTARGAAILLPPLFLSHLSIFYSQTVSYFNELRTVWDGVPRTIYLQIVLYSKPFNTVLSGTPKISVRDDPFLSFKVFE